MNRDANTQVITLPREQRRQSKLNAIDRARRLVKQFDAGERDRMRREEHAKRKKITAARLTLAALVEGAMIENPAFADQMRRRAMRLLSAEEFALVAGRLDDLSAEYGGQDTRSTQSA